MEKIARVYPRDFHIYPFMAGGGDMATQIKICSVENNFYLW